MKFEEYLLNELYDIATELGIENKINVAEYRSFKMPDNKEDLLFVIRYITGNYVGNVKTQPMQIFCYSQLNDMQSAYLILDTFSKKHNNYQTTIDGNFIKMNFETPVSMRNFVQSETGYRASVYCFGTYIECEGAFDFAKITIGTGNSETAIPYLSASLGYVAVLNTTKVSGQQLNKSIKQEAGLTLSLSLMNTGSDFCKDIRDIMFGTKAGNTAFVFNFYTDDDSLTADYSVTMKLESSTLPSDKQSASVLTLTFRN